MCKCVSVIGSSGVLDLGNKCKGNEIKRQRWSSNTNAISYTHLHTHAPHSKVNGDDVEDKCRFLLCIILYRRHRRCRRRLHLPFRRCNIVSPIASNRTVQSTRIHANVVALMSLQATHNSLSFACVYASERNFKRYFMRFYHARWLSTRVLACVSEWNIILFIHAEFSSSILRCFAYFVWVRIPI